jgi:hypothetical protein
MASLFNKEVGLYRYNSAVVVPINTHTFDLDFGEVLNDSDGTALSLHVISIGTSGVITVTQSNNETGNFVAISGENVNSGAVVFTINAAGLYVIPIAARFIRVTMTTATTAGTTDLRVSVVPGSNYRQVFVANSPGIGINAGTNNIGQVAAQAPNVVTDVASAAITTSATTAAITPTAGTSYSVNIPVTAVSGTLPTLDVGIEESDDYGTNWVRVYDFPRITAVGSYRSPPMPATGNRVRYVQTVGGTTPSLTRAINRVQLQTDEDHFRQIIDRTLVPNTLNSVTPTLVAQNVGNQVKLSVAMGAITTTAPQIQLEGSDDNGATWQAVGAPVTAVASSTVTANNSGQDWSLYRARVSTAGVGATMGSILIRAHS